MSTSRTPIKSSDGEDPMGDLTMLGEQLDLEAPQAALESTQRANNRFLTSMSPVSGPLNTAAASAGGRNVASLSARPTSGSGPPPPPPSAATIAGPSTSAVQRAPRPSVSSGAPWSQSVNRVLMRNTQKQVYASGLNDGRYKNHGDITAELNAAIGGQTMDGYVQGERSKAAVTQQLKKIREKLEEDPSYDGAQM